MKRAIATTLFLFASTLVFCAQAKPGDSAATAKAGPKAAAAVKKTAAAAGPAAKTENAGAVKPARATDTLVLVGRLVEIPGAMPPNDLYNYVFIMKYRVMKVETGSYDGREILVGVYNPLIPRKRITDAMQKGAAGDVDKFVVGDRHRLWLVLPIDRVWKDAVEDDYIDSELDKYYAVRTEMVR